MRYKGMTVNERLQVSGQMEEFDKQVKRKDVNKITTILKSVELTNESIEPILKNLKLDLNVISKDERKRRNFIHGILDFLFGLFIRS